MAYVVTDNCIRCKYTDCVDICPCDCFHEGENMLVIDPDSCIDCGICEPECPADAIRPDTEPGMQGWLAFNADWAARWPQIVTRREPLAGADAHDGVSGKLARYFSGEPGVGD